MTLGINPAAPSPAAMKFNGTPGGPPQYDVGGTAGTSPMALPQVDLSQYSQQPGPGGASPFPPTFNANLSPGGLNTIA